MAARDAAHRGRRRATCPSATDRARYLCGKPPGTTRRRARKRRGRGPISGGRRGWLLTGSGGYDPGRCFGPGFESSVVGSTNGGAISREDGERLRRTASAVHHGHIRPRRRGGFGRGTGPRPL